jgi:2-dehydro-3-deoxyphosphogluconate aldolase/(4S)-4-hydroxy-2-oxoglutarate aldolase
MNIRSIMRLAPVIPVITIEEPEQALPLAEALLQGGLRVLEITLRTPAGLAAISAIRQQFPEAVVGAGTVIDKAGFAAAADSGAQFIVSPGCTTALLQAASNYQLPLLPGVCTPSEVMQLLEQGITAMKFFPAEPAGGIDMLKAMAAPLPQALFCPTGGITYEKAAAYLALPNVACIGGSWMVNRDWVSNGRWLDIQAAAHKAAALAT